MSALARFSLLLLLPLLANTATGGPPRELVIATSSSIPPFVIAGNDTGIVVDIMRAALGMTGYQLDFVYAPNHRLALELTAGKVDAVYNLPKGLLPDAHYSDPVIKYLNVAISLSEHQWQIDSLEDLQTLRLVAFQNATGFIGPEFAAIANSNPGYQEVSQQRAQVAMLFSGRADAILLDINVFGYLRDLLSDNMDTSAPVTVHRILPPAPRFAAFVDPEVRDDFNSGLARLRESGEYQAIVERYLPNRPSQPSRPAQQQMKDQMEDQP